MSTSEELLTALSGPHLEFDRTSLLVMSGICALHLNKNETAVLSLQQAAKALPEDTLIRQVLVLLPLMIAYARQRNQQDCMVSAEKAFQFIGAIDSSALKRQFLTYCSSTLLETFPRNTHVADFVDQAQRQFFPET